MLKEFEPVACTFIILCFSNCYPFTPTSVNCRLKPHKNTTVQFTPYSSSGLQQIVCRWKRWNEKMYSDFISKKVFNESAWTQYF